MSIYRHCLDISTEQWVELLGDKTVFKDNDITLLEVLYKCPGHRQKASVLALLLGVSSHSVLNLQIGRLGKRIINKFPDIQFPTRENGTIRYWHIPFWGEVAETKGQFLWELRPELKKAIEKLSYADEVRMPYSPISISSKKRVKIAEELFDEEIDKLPEGAEKQTTVNAYERNPKARKLCIVNSNSTNKVERTITSLLPNEEDRKICLSLFLEALKKANSCGSNKWGAYCYKEGVRLLVGSLIVFTIHKDRIWLALDKQMLNERTDKRKLLEDSELWNWEKDDYSEYIPVPSMNGYYLPSSEDLEILPIIRDFHFTYIEKVAQYYQWLMSTSQPKHSKELLEYLGKELGQSVPSPNYNTDPNTKVLKNNEKYKRSDKESSEMLKPYLDKVPESVPESIKIEIKDVPVRNLKEINLKETEEDLKETEEKEVQREKQLITYLRNDEAQEKANGLHKKTLRSLTEYFKNKGLNPKENVIDLLVENQNKVFIFEVKSIHTDNFTYQTRSAIGQLIQYEYFEVKKKSNFKDMEIHKGVVYSKEPPKEFIEFLEACDLGVYWINNNEIIGSEGSMKILTAFVQLQKKF